MTYLEAELMRKVKGIKGNSQYDSWKYGERRRANLEVGKMFHELQELAQKNKWA